ncbi:protein kinase [Micromonospora sp. CPCC 205539]|uniref:serine/threonine-protein kinase n=1 Tax=Micromonospora sp. CPCC 205539 TaxID=3122408 RepID=UPI002FF29F3A
MLRDQLLAGRYRLLERLGSGGMSAVHRAYDEVLERDVAVKVLVTSDVNARQRIRAEAKAAAKLSHPHVTSVYDYGESPLDGAPVPFVVMELLGGHTLEQRLAAGPLSPRAGLRVCAEVAAALTAAHAQGLVHRDIKPGNVMLTPTGAKVLDFGIAAVVGDSEIDFEGRLLGTPAYLAPERLAAGEVLPASDVYALGLLMHTVLTGRLPQSAEAQAAPQGPQPHTDGPHPHPHPRTDPHSRTHPDTPTDPNLLPAIDGVPAEVHRLYRWCLARDPADRPPAAEAARILLIAGGPTTSDRSTAKATNAANSTNAAGHVGAVPGRTRRRSWRQHRRRAVLAVGGAVVAVVAMAGSLGDFSNRRQEAGLSRTGIGSGGTTTVGLPLAADPSEVTPRPTAAPASGSPPSARTSPAGPVGTRAPNPSASSTGQPSAGVASTPQPAPSPASGIPVRARGGTVTVRCVGGSAEVLAVAPASGFRAEAYDPGPAKRVEVVLVSNEHSSQIRVSCPSGRPKPKVKERAN